LKWITGKLPRMIAVQAHNCKPVVELWNGNIPDVKAYIGRPSVANGLAVPQPFGWKMIMNVLKASRGTAIAVTESAIIQGTKEIAKHEGMLPAPEGGALWSALVQLLDEGVIGHEENILLLNTGSGYKYLENLF
jgi:threonine synthase